MNDAQRQRAHDSIVSPLALLQECRSAITGVCNGIYWPDKKRVRCSGAVMVSRRSRYLARCFPGKRRTPVTGTCPYLVKIDILGSSRLVDKAENSRSDQPHGFIWSAEDMCPYDLVSRDLCCIAGCGVPGEGKSFRDDTRRQPHRRQGRLGCSSGCDGGILCMSARFMLRTGKAETEDCSHEKE